MRINTAILCLTLLLFERPGIAQTRVNIVANVSLNDVAIKEIPSYIRVNDMYILLTEGVGLNSQPSIGFALGLQVQKPVFKSWSLYSGLELNYRRAHLTYYNNNLFFYDRVFPPRLHTFSADLKYDYIMAQVPLGIMVPIHSKFYLDVAILTNLVIKILKDRAASDPQFDYQLVSLEHRSTNPVLVELAIGATFQTNNYSLKLRCIRGINAIESKTDNGYNQLIPADLYFKSISLSMQIRMQALFSLHKKG